MYFFFNDTATTEIYTLSLHDALPISFRLNVLADIRRGEMRNKFDEQLQELNDEMIEMGEKIIDSITRAVKDRKSTRLNSSHANISYAVFCLKKKKKVITSCTTPS